MRRINVVRTLTSLLLLLIAVQAEGAFQFRDGWTKWMVWTTPSNAAAIAADVNAIVLWNYGEASLLYVPSASALKVRASSLRIDAIDDRIVWGGPYDPQTGIPSSVPPELREMPYGAGVIGAYLVQFIGPSAGDWEDAVANLGVVCSSYGIANHASVCSGTSQQMAAIAALPSVQFVDYWHPFQKGGLPDGLVKDPRQRVWLRYELVPSSDSENARRELWQEAEWVNDNYSLLIQAGKIPRLLQNRLLLWTGSAELSDPLIDSVWPRRAPAGERIVITGDVFAGLTVTFNGIPSPKVEFLQGSRMSAVVPAGVSIGPADVIVHGPNHSSQIALGFEVGGQPDRDDFLRRDDLMPVDSLVNNTFEMMNQFSRVRWLMPDATLRAFGYWGPVNAAAFFDEHQRLNIVDAKKTTVLDARLSDIGAGPPFLAGATTVVMDRENRYVVARGRTISLYSHTGELVRVMNTVFDVQHLDLAADQCTVAYCDHAIERVNVCTGTPLAPIDMQTRATNVRFLPDGSLLAVDGPWVRRYSPEGVVLVERQYPYEIPRPGGAIGISADADYAWISHEMKFLKYELATNRVVQEMLPPRPAQDGHLILVYGGWTAARGFAPPDPLIERVTRLPGGRIEIVGAGFIDGVTLTIAGQTIIIDEQTETVIRGHVAGGLPLNGVIVVTAPNGKNVSLALSTPIPTLSEWAAALFVIALAGLGAITLRLRCV